MTNYTRRDILGLALVGGVGLAAAPVLALEGTDYNPAALDALNGAGKPFLIDFYATWCGTCRAQERVIEGLRGENAAYEAIPILRVNWDQHGNGELVRALGIPRRSTLVIMKDGMELGRLVAQTGKSQIAALLDLAI